MDAADDNGIVSQTLLNCGEGGVYGAYTPRASTNPEAAAMLVSPTIRSPTWHTAHESILNRCEHDDVDDFFTRGPTCSTSTPMFIFPA